jgi:riboflavin synthase
MLLLMFTGIVERTVSVLSALDHPGGRRLVVERVWDDLVLGESIACNGCCLTVAYLEEGKIHFDLIRETLNRTNLGIIHPGDQLNVERSLRAGARIDGHFVQGHVDGTGVLIHKVSNEIECRYTIEVPEQLAKYLAPKGSISVDGVSLTIAGLKDRRFEVALIPTTLQLTNMANRAIGWPFNLECDMIAKQIVTFMEIRKEMSSVE